MAQVGSTLSSLKSVFGGGLTLYGYRRGAGTPGSGTPNINHYSGIGVGPVTLAAFNGLYYPVIAIPINYATQSIGTPAVATAIITYSSAGTCSGTNSGSGNWLLAGSAGNYEIMFNKTTGSNFDSGTANTWQALSSSRSISISISNNVKSCGGYIAIRDTLASVELSNVAFSMDVDSS